jgi:hypothetical protein
MDSTNVKCCSVLVACLLLKGAAVGDGKKAQALPQAKEVVKRALKAVYGGRAVNKKKLRSWYVKYRGTYRKGAETGTVESELWISGDFSHEKMCEKGNNGAKTTITVMTPKHRWTVCGRDKREDSNAAQPRHVARVLDLYPLLEDDRFRLTVLGEERVNWVGTVVLRVAAAGQPDVTLYFAKTTGLLVKVEVITYHLWVLPVRVQGFLSDYRRVDGVQVALKRSIVVHSYREDLKVVECRALDTIDRKLFRKPW